MSFALRPGHGVLLSSVKRRYVDDDNEVCAEATFGKPRGKHHLLLYLGTWKPGRLGADARLNELGWVFDPKRATKLCEEREKAGEKR